MTTKKKQYVTPALVIVPANTEGIMAALSQTESIDGDAKDNNFSTDNGDHSSDGNGSWGNSPWGE